MAVGAAEWRNTMRQRLADYVADFMVAHGVTDCFSVVGNVFLT